MSDTTSDEIPASEPLPTTAVQAAERPLPPPGICIPLGMFVLGRSLLGDPFLSMSVRKW